MMQRAPLNDDDIDSALMMLENEMKRDRLKAAASSKNPLVPSPPMAKDLIIDHNENKFSLENELMDLMRPKRSTDDKMSDVENGTVQFHHTVDEINEDTLKIFNLSGTIQAKKLDMVKQPTLSRRTGGLLNKNSSNSLQIEYNKPILYQHINDNKIDTTVQAEDKFDHQLSGNITQQQKDKDLSKFIVNELKSGIEVIGDKNAPIMSNVTFTPENDTLTAMTFIAGNLLKKLWNMERDSRESLEIDVLKHEKIADLLELFKEPLTMRQESFLKNTLDQLSNAIDQNKDIRNISLCNSIGNLNKVNFFNNRETTERSGEEKRIKFATEKDKQKSTKSDAIKKINVVMDLIKKFENVKQHVNDLKHKSEDSKFHSHQINLNKTEEYSLSLFGGILEKITKLIMPQKSSKNMVNKIKAQNIFNNAKGFENKIKDIFNIDIRNTTVTAKDKIVLDYLQHVDSNPDCLLNRKAENTVTKPKSSLEGDILLNLSEFFKIKSLGDLVQMISSGTKNATDDLPNIRTLREPKKDSEVKLTQITTTETPKNRTKTLSDTKVKLKAHLKTILEDIIEMQIAKGLPKGKETIEISDILPCIYNILNSNDETKIQKAEKINPIKKITVIFENLKKDLRYTHNSRRSNFISERPQSAVVWDRLIKNLNDKQKLGSRRSFKAPNIPKTYEELKKIMDQTESGSNTYKTVVLVNEVPAANKLTLLKTIDMDVKKNIYILEQIKVSLEAGRVPKNKLSEMAEYVDNVGTNIILNGKVIRSTNKQKSRKFFVDNIDSKKRKSIKNKVNTKQFIRVGNATPVYGSNTKITRDQIINQLIKNRLNLFMRIKEASESDLSEDINYDIAKKILVYLDRGNHVIAKELYKVFVSRYQKDEIANGTKVSTKTNDNDNARRGAIQDKESSVNFEQAKVDDVPLMSHDHLLKQLINIKNMNI